ncbi:MAG: S41 family peptidase [Phycisphaerae bacterium]|nr:S41 family peptidase [Phycisphaerae bacterium]
MPPALQLASADAIREHVGREFFDSFTAAQWVERHAELGQHEPPEDWAAAARGAVAELRASHTEYISPDDPRHAALRAIFLPNESLVERDGIGIDVVQRDGRSFVSRVAAASSAAALGLIRGDEIVSCDGVPFEPVRSLEGKESVLLELRHSPLESTSFRTVPIKRECVRASWLAAQRAGAHTESTGDVFVRVIPIYSGAGDEYLQALEDDICGPLRRCDALVLDLRDGFGGCTPEWARLFSTDVPIVDSVDRNGRKTRYDSQWRGELVLLVNGGTRSGKEMLARSLQRSGRATIVGERTGGAVLGGRLFELPDGGLLYLATQDVRIDGERLEGVGVVPDVAVADDIAFAAGRDPALARAIEVAAEKVRDARRAGTLPGCPP